MLSRGRVWSVCSETDGMRRCHTRLGLTQGVGATLRPSNSQTLQIWSVSPAAIAGVQGCPRCLDVLKLVMRKAKIVGTSNRVHARLDGLQMMSRMPTFAGEASQAFPHGAIQPFNKVAFSRLPPNVA